MLYRIGLTLFFMLFFSFSVGFANNITTNNTIKKINLMSDLLQTKVNHLPTDNTKLLQLQIQMQMLQIKQLNLLIALRAKQEGHLQLVKDNK